MRLSGGAPSPSNELMVSGRPGRQELPAELARARPEVEHEVGRLDHLAVVLHDEHRVAQVAEVRQRVDQLGVVARVEPDATARRARRARP